MPSPSLLPFSPASPTLRVAGAGLHAPLPATTSSDMDGWLFLHFCSAGELTLAGDTIPIATDDWWLVPASARPASVLPVNWLRLGADLAALARRHGLLLDAPQALGASAGAVAHLLHELDAELSHPRPFREEALDLSVRRLLLVLRREQELGARPSLTSRMVELTERLALLRRQIAGSLAEPWTIARMAAEVHLSRSRFMRLYREFTGRSPLEDLIDVRIRHARHLLVTTTLSISQVGFACGFQSPGHFARAFRKRTGCLPSVFGAKPSTHLASHLPPPAPDATASVAVWRQAG